MDGVQLWNLETAEVVNTYAKGLTVLDASFSPDLIQVIVALNGWERDSEAQIWDLQTASVVQCFKGHQREVYTACFSNDSDLALTASGDGTARLWKVDSGQCEHIFDLWNECSMASFSQDGSLILVASVASGRTHIFRAQYPWQQVRSIPGGRAWFSPDGASLITSHLQLWDVHSWVCLMDFFEDVSPTTLVFSSDGFHIYSSNTEGDVKLWSRWSRNHLKLLVSERDDEDDDTDSDGEFHHMDVSPDGKSILTATLNEVTL